MSSCKLVNLSKIYHSGEVALYDVNFEASDREFIAVTGGEHSGKTSLLRIIAGLDECSAGTIYVGDKVMNEVPPRNRNIAMIFQAGSLQQTLTVYDIIGFGLKMRKVAPAIIDRKVKATAEILGLTDVLYRKPKLLSAEQKQKVAMARAIAREPQVYLWDDPLSGLDANLKARMLSVVMNLQARMQGTFIYATKNINEAMTMASRIIVLKDGFVQQIDTPANLYDYPANAYVAFFVGSPTVNFIKKASLVTKEDGVYAESCGVSLKLAENIVARLFEGYVDSGKQVILGIRPEDCSLCATAEGLLSGTVNGFESGYTEVKITEETYVVASGTGIEKGKKATVNADLSKMYIFDEETQLSILKRDSGYVDTKKPDADFVPLTIAEEKEIKAKLSPKKEKSKKRK